MSVINRPRQEMVVEYQEDYIRNARGIQLFTCKWLPLSSPTALVFLCHGYGMECSGFMRVIANNNQTKNNKRMPFLQYNVNMSESQWCCQHHVLPLLMGWFDPSRSQTYCGTRLANAGYAVFGLDYQGHGRSKGPRCYIKKFKNIVNDCDDYFKSVCAQEEYRDKSRFLYGESMGGAVALLIHKKNPSFWNGAILVAPMCKISEKVKPHPVLVNILTSVEEIIPKWKIVPTKDVIDAAFKDPRKRDEVRNNKLIYQDKPRLKTALEMLRTSISLEESLNEVTLPFLVLHGEADIVTDPEVSKALYVKAGSRDKTIKLYPGMWHALTSGEPDHNVDIVFADIINWLDKHSSSSETDATTLVAPIHESFNNVEAKTLIMNGMDSPEGQKQQHRRRFLCGLKGGRMFHHSAM